MQKMSFALIKNLLGSIAINNNLYSEIDELDNSCLKGYFYNSKNFSFKIHYLMQDTRYSIYASVVRPNFLKGRPLHSIEEDSFKKTFGNPAGTYTLDPVGGNLWVEFSIDSAYMAKLGKPFEAIYYPVPSMSNAMCCQLIANYVQNLKRLQNELNRY